MRRSSLAPLILLLAVEAAAAGGLYFWGAPTFSQVRIGWNEARAACSDYAKFSFSRMEAEFPGGGKIVYRSLDDPDNARGFTVDGCILDEVGDIKGASWYEIETMRIYWNMTQSSDTQDKFLKKALERNPELQQKRAKLDAEKRQYWEFSEDEI